MHLHFHPAGLILYVNTIICLILALLVWARRVKPGGVIFGLLSFPWQPGHWQPLWKMAALIMP